MRRITRNLLLMALPALVAVIVAGCGGGGGGSSTPPTNGTFTLSGTVQDLSSHTGIRGAVVTIGSTTATTGNNGTFTISIPSAPPAGSTFSVNLTGASPAVYPDWASLNGIAQHPAAIGLPGVGSGSNLGTIYVITSADNPPPPPIN